MLLPRHLQLRAHLRTQQDSVWMNTCGDTYTIQVSCLTHAIKAVDKSSKASAELPASKISLVATASEPPSIVITDPLNPTPPKLYSSSSQRCCHTDSCNGDTICALFRRVLRDPCARDYFVFSNSCAFQAHSGQNAGNRCCFVDQCSGAYVCSKEGDFVRDSCQTQYRFSTTCQLEKVEVLKPVDNTPSTGPTGVRWSHNNYCSIGVHGTPGSSSRRSLGSHGSSVSHRSHGSRVVYHRSRSSHGSHGSQGSLGSRGSHGRNGRSSSSYRMWTRHGSSGRGLSGYRFQSRGSRSSQGRTSFGRSQGAHRRFR